MENKTKLILGACGCGVLIFLALIGAIVGGISGGVGGDNTGGDTSGEAASQQITDPAKIREALVGTWEEPDLGSQFIFTSEGKVTEVSAVGSNTFDWKLSDDGKTITMGLDVTDSETSSTISLKSITETTFKGGLVTALNDRPLPITYKKIKSPESEKTANTKKPKPTMPKTGPAKPEIGETVKFADSEWVVREAKDLGSSLKSGNDFIENLTSDAGTYVQVEFSVKNTTNEEEQILNTPKLKADGGARYEQLGSSSSYIPEGKNTMTLEALPAGLPKVFYAIYEVPKDAVKGLSFEARELAGSLFSEPKTKLVDLALGGGGGDAGSKQKKTEKPKPTQSKQKIDKTVKFADSEWIVRGAENLGSSLKSNNPFGEDLTSDAGTYVQIEFSVKNTTNEEEQILNTPKLKADGGARYEQLGSSSFYIPEGKNTMTLEALPAGLPKVFYAIYEVPKDAVKGLSFEARELAGSLFSEPKTKLIDLGLN